MKIEGMKRELVMLFEIEDGETFAFPNNVNELYLKTTMEDTQPSLTKRYKCVKLSTGDVFDFSEACEVVKCKAKVVVE